jgi:hypothetical protein
MKIQPAQLDLYFEADTATAGDSRSYIDTAKELSKVNRRLYEQGRLYAYQGLTFIWKQNASQLATIECTVRTAGNTWVVHNAFVKGEALWNEMQDLVLDDNPSIKGKWHDYKIRLSSQMVSARILAAKDGAGNDYDVGGWDLSTYVMPQHETVEDPANPGTWIPLPAEEKTAALIGADTTSIRSLVKAYEESRATVQSPMPNVPAGMSDSFFNLLTDSGSQEPELADVIEDENDTPPYDLDEYPGSDTNAPVPVNVGYGAISAQEVDGRIGPFIAPCGLLEIEIKGYDQAGDEIATASMPTIGLLLHVAPGMYKGVAAVPMGQ